MGPVKMISREFAKIDEKTYNQAMTDMMNTPKTYAPELIQKVEGQHAVLSRGVEHILGGEKEINGEKRDGLFVKLLDSLENKRPLKIKFGMDPTATDLHLGHTVALTKMRQFQEFGHIAQPLIGDGTTLIGDPAGRNKTRPLLALEEIRENAKTYLEQIDKVLLQDEAVYDIRYNGDWLLKLDFQDLIKLCADVTVSQIIQREDFAKRLNDNQPISLHELLYPIMQGYDSVAMDCDIEFGGTDQTFNLLMGRQLMDKRGMRPQIAMTFPLLEGTDGVEKMSKSKNNYIGVAEAPAEMFGKIMSISDDMMRRYYEILTDVDLSTLPEHPMDAKKQLGRIIVERFHSAEDAQEAQQAFEARFSKGDMPDEMPEVAVELPQGVLSVVVSAGFAASNGEARRLVQQGGVKLDGEKITDPKAEITAGGILQVGKLKIAKIVA